MALGKAGSALFQRELRAAFAAPSTVAVFALLALIATLIQHVLLARYNFMVLRYPDPATIPRVDSFVLEPYFQWMLIVLAVLIPSFTMRSFAEERRIGTFEMLITAPVTLGQLLLAKFASVVLVSMAAVLVAATLPITLTLVLHAAWGGVLAGLLGIALASVAFAAVGIAASAFSDMPAIAAIFSLGVIFLMLLAHLPGPTLGPDVQSISEALSASTHAYTFFRGVVTLHGIVYFSVVTLLGLSLARIGLDMERI